MRLSVIFPVHNQHPLAQAAIDVAVHNLSGETDVEIIVLDNASMPSWGHYGPNGARLPIPSEAQMAAESGEIPMTVAPKTCTIKAFRKDKNIGVYPTFWWGLSVATGDVLAFLHSDLMVAEKGWDKRVLEAFEADSTLGMVGFIGSNEIDGAGGRGLGTCSNFMGQTYKSSSKDGVKEWTGSPAEPHGRRMTGLEPAMVEDGCAMIFRRSCLEAISQRADFPPHHFYDRLLSCEVREKGYWMATLGIGCDHISGQTVNQEASYGDMAREWCEAHGLTMEGSHNWDNVVYREAERQWLKEYRDEKHLIPCRV